MLFRSPLALFAGMAFTPAVWSYDVKNHPSPINPIAGPDTGFGIGGPGGFGGMRNGGMGRPNFDPRNFANRPPGQNFPQGMRPQFGGQFPGGQQQMGGGPGAMFGEQNNKELISYLQSNRGGAKYLLATFGGMSAAPFIKIGRAHV